MKLSLLIFLLGIFTNIAFCTDDVSVFKYNAQKTVLIEKSFGHVDSLQGARYQPVKPFTAALYSAIVPGLGQYMSESYIKAALFATIEVAAWTAYFIYDSKGAHQDEIMRDFGDRHWSQKRYWSKLYSLGQSNKSAGIGGFENFPDYNFNTANNLLSDYDAQIVESLRVYENLFPGFTHSLPRTNTQQYYEMIYKYLHQFGNGWDDADFMTTYDGYKNILTPNISRYRDLRDTTDEFYDFATAASMTALVNHVLSALDAAWTARSKNREYNLRFGMHIKPYYGEQVKMYGLQLGF